MGKRIILLFTVAILGVMILPSLAFGKLVNEYGMHYAGQDTCLGCHARMSGRLKVDSALHGHFATAGISPAVPGTWSVFKAAGDVGSQYSITGLDWITLGDSSTTGNSATEYLFFKGSSDPTVMPWNLIEGLAWAPGEGWKLSADDPSVGLADGSYTCQRCHQLGTTMNGTGVSIPNPAASISPSAGTAVQWARDESTSVTDFTTSASVSTPGLGIQCENCHGTGVAATTGDHMGTGVGVSTSLAVLGQSQVCGQCHGSFTNKPGTLGIYGYTANLPLRDFVDVNGVSKGQSYTKIPTEAEFMANPTAYWMFPNGSNAKANHYYYDEWSASAHSYRAALAFSSPSPAPADAMTFQAAGNGHYSNKFDPALATGCYKCHTGEGYLKTKGAGITTNFTPAPDNVGKMGQECVTCHNGHPSGVGASDVVRAPDKAGVRSATGLSVDNASICEDCHNWQMEVLGQTPNPAPMADLSAHGGASHPQRETLHGRSVMFDVANGTEFMPGAKCENCHMPKTNSAATRISHGMKPMLPGDAERWNTAAGAAYKGQDSCSGCHTSRTRDQLQANIDGWQADATAQAAKVATAIAAAKTKSEFSATVTTKPGYVLVGRATWNYKAFQNDASRSVHNPTYVMAGLKKAEQMAMSVGGKFAHAGATATVRKGRAAHVAGQVVNGNGSGAAGAAVTLLRGSTVLGTTMADSHGNFAFTMKVSKTYKNYKVKWTRSGSSLTNLFSGYMTIRVR